MGQGQQTVSILDVDERVAAKLGESAARYTGARRLLVAALVRFEGPVSAAELHEVLRKDVPLSSLYRTLSVLSEAGVIDRTHDAAGMARYELAEWLKGHHHHLVCVECGDVQDLEVAPKMEDRLDTLVTQISRGSGFRVDSHRLDVEGWCANCQSS